MINQKEGHSCWETRLHFLAHAGHHQRVRKLGQALALRVKRALNAAQALALRVKRALNAAQALALRVKRALNAAQALAQRALRGADGGDGSHHLNGERGGGGSSKRAPASKAT